MISDEPEAIVAAAVMLSGCIVRWLDPPARHVHVLWAIAFNGAKIGYEKQGFVTNYCRFVDRAEAGRIAIASGQIKALRWPPDLYSEDLW